MAQLPVHCSAHEDQPVEDKEHLFPRVLLTGIRRTYDEKQLNDGDTRGDTLQYHITGETDAENKTFAAGTAQHNHGEIGSLQHSGVMQQDATRSGSEGQKIHQKRYFCKP